MSKPSPSPASPAGRSPGALPELEFAAKYDVQGRALRYLEKHQGSFGQRLSNRREIAMARRALRLAGDPATVLDVPCGAGRFWELLAEHPSRRIYAADLSPSMIEVALRMRPPEVVRRVEARQASAFALPYADGQVDTVFCMRLLHHLGDAGHRLQLLRELARVSGRSVIVSLWTGCCFKAWRWRVRTRRQPARNRFWIPRSVVEGEFAKSGLTVVKRLRLLPCYSMWTIYVLQKQEFRVENQPETAGSGDERRGGGNERTRSDDRKRDRTLAGDS